MTPEPLEEVDVRAYLRRTKHGAVRVRRHTRGIRARAGRQATYGGLASQLIARRMYRRYLPARAREKVSRARRRMSRGQAFALFADKGRRIGRRLWNVGGAELWDVMSAQSERMQQKRQRAADAEAARQTPGWDPAALERLWDKRRTERGEPSESQKIFAAPPPGGYSSEQSRRLRTHGLENDVRRLTRKRFKAEVQLRRAEKSDQKVFRVTEAYHDGSRIRTRTLTLSREEYLRRQRAAITKTKRELRNAMAKLARLSESQFETDRLAKMRPMRQGGEMYEEFAWADELDRDELDELMELGLEDVMAHMRRTKHGLVRVQRHVRKGGAQAARRFARTSVGQSVQRRLAAAAAVHGRALARARVKALRLADLAATGVASYSTVKANINPTPENVRKAESAKALRDLASTLDTLDMRRAMRKQSKRTGNVYEMPTSPSPRTELSPLEAVQRELDIREMRLEQARKDHRQALLTNDPQEIMRRQRDVEDLQRSVRSLKARLARMTEAFAEACLAWIDEQEELLQEAVTRPGTRQRAKKPYTGYYKTHSTRYHSTGKVHGRNYYPTKAGRRAARKAGHSPGTRPKSSGHNWGAHNSARARNAPPRRLAKRRLPGAGMKIYGGLKTNKTGNVRHGQSYRQATIRGMHAHVYGSGANRKVIVVKRKKA